MEATKNPTTIGSQMKGVRKGQRIAIHGVHLGGGVDHNTNLVTYKGRRNGSIVVEGFTSDSIFVDPNAVGVVER